MKTKTNNLKLTDPQLFYLFTLVTSSNKMIKRHLDKGQVGYQAFEDMNGIAPSEIDKLQKKLKTLIKDK